MSQFVIVAADLVAVAILAFGLFHPRHHRRDLVVALLGINVGVLAVSLALTSTEVSAGLGLGLFGVLSIIRLRSTELEQHEVAYVFVSLALGMLGGIVVAPVWLSLVLMAAMLGAIWVGDHPRLFPRSRAERVLLDRAHTHRDELHARVEALFSDAEIRAVKVRKVDLVRDTTDIEVRMVARHRTGMTSSETPAGRVERDLPVIVAYPDGRHDDLSVVARRG